MDHNLLAGEIHQDNVKAGWWKHEYFNQEANRAFTAEELMAMPIGESVSVRIIPRNIGELICLMHSEISEAYEGFKFKINDDHLPEHEMFEVELADACICIYDTLGYYGHPVEIYEVPWTFASAPVNTILLEIHLRLSMAMEGFRKGDEKKGCDYLCSALRHIWSLAKREHILLETIIEEKREYNRNRADRKIENRAKEGGKEF
jgi:hypothetical protein